MELDYLREFVVLAETCQFLETANKLFISQSSLSKHIKALEKELGVDLLDRSTRRVELSSYGKDFLPYAQRIVAIQDEYNQDFLHNLNEQQHTVIIGMVPFVTMFKMKGFIRNFFKSNPNYHIEVEEHSGGTLRDGLRKNRFDIIITLDDPENFDDSEFCRHQYTTDTLVAVLPKNHSLVKRGVLTVKELSRFPSIQLGKTTLTSFFEPSLPPVSITTSNGRAFMNSVGDGIGIGITTRHCAAYYMEDDLVALPIEPEITVRMNIMYNKPTRHNEKVINSLLEYVDQKDVELKNKP